MFGRLFGSTVKKPEPAPADLNTSIQKLKQAISTLDKREEHLQKKLMSVLLGRKKNLRKKTRKERYLN